ncbi:MAG: phosphomannomutase/phosphoglucomutase [Bacillota bacterium]
MGRVNPEIFREYDVRGVVGEDLTEDTVQLIGRAFGTYVKRQGAKTVVVGRDNRKSSSLFRDAIIAGLTRSGLDVVDIGLVVTPIFYFARIHLGIAAGVMVTGSHNPPEFNGFKLGWGPGTLYGEEIRRLWTVISESDFEEGTGSVLSADVVPAYMDSVLSRVRLGPKKLKVVADAGNGTAGLFVKPLLEQLGCEVIPLFLESDPDFPNHFPDPVRVENLAELIETVRRERADLGVAFDGDADRLGVVDDTGNILWGDTLMILYWREILKKHPGSRAIIEVKCSQALVDEVKRLGGKPEFYRTGHSLIKARMRETGALFAGEMSGHLFFADEYYGFDDALYAAARLLRILSADERKLSEIVADIPRYCSTPELRVDCPDAAKFKVVAEAREYFSRTHPVIDVDGARVLFENGWGLIRASNTQPVIVVRCEGKTPEDLLAIKQEVFSYLSRFPEVDLSGIT